MIKKVLLNGVEIYASSNHIPVEKLFGFVRDVVNSLESKLVVEDRTLRLKIQFRFFPKPDPKHRIHMNGFRNRRIREKVIRILHRSTSVFTKGVAGNIQVELHVQYFQ